MRFFLVLILLGLAMPAMAQEKAEAVIDPGLNRRLELAEKMHEIWPVRVKVEEALENASLSFPPEKRAEFKAGMRKAIKYDLLEEESITAMANIFTEKELQAMIDFYGSPEGRAVGEKTNDYVRALEPVMTKMLDQALIEVRTGQ